MARRLTVLAVALALTACAITPPATDATDVAQPSPERAQELLEKQARAEAAYAGGNNREAADLYTALAKERPGDAAYWYRLGNALVRINAFADAGFAYRRTVMLEPGNSRAWHNLGIVHMHLAQESLAEAVKHAGEDTPVFNESLKLSAGLYSLVDAGGSPATPPAAAQPLQGAADGPSSDASEPTPVPEAGRQL